MTETKIKEQSTNGQAPADLQANLNQQFTAWLKEHDAGALILLMLPFGENAMISLAEAANKLEPAQLQKWILEGRVQIGIVKRNDHANL